MEQAEAAQQHMAAVEGAKQDNSQCSITDDQVKEMWLHMRPEVRAMFENWARANALSDGKALYIASGDESEIERWRILSIDTGRLIPLRFRPLLFRMIPSLSVVLAGQRKQQQQERRETSQSSEDDADALAQQHQEQLQHLFRVAMSVLQKRALAFTLLLSRYERVEKGMLVAVHCPMDCIKEFIRSQCQQDQMELAEKERTRQQQSTEDEDGDDALLKRLCANGVPIVTADGQSAGIDGIGLSSSTEASTGDTDAATSDGKPPDPVAEEGKRLWQYWKRRGVSLDIYRSFAYSMYSIREELDPPVIIITSLVDDAKPSILVPCRHASLFESDFYSSIPLAEDMDVVPWPIQDHRKDSKPPMVLCQSPQCTRVGQLATNPKVMDETYRKHCSSMQETWSAKRKARAREHWNNVVYPQALEEIEEVKTSAAKLEDETEDQYWQRVCHPIIMKHDQELREYEDTVIAKQIEEEETTCLKRCARCGVVFYCSRDCQVQHWPEHKRVCRARTAPGK